MLTMVDIVTKIGGGSLEIGFQNISISIEWLSSWCGWVMGPYITTFLSQGSGGSLSSGGSSSISLGLSGSSSGISSGLSVSLGDILLSGPVVQLILWGIKTGKLDG